MKDKKTEPLLSAPRRRVLQQVADHRGLKLADLLAEIVDDYLASHHEAIELMNIPGFHGECLEGLDEICAGGGKRLCDLDC